jgi:hypothetical protein
VEMIIHKERTKEAQWIREEGGSDHVENARS